MTMVFDVMGWRVPQNALACVIPFLFRFVL